MSTAEGLPIPVLEHPHWRVNFQPGTFEKDRIRTLQECLEVVQKNRVRLRGWDFPHIGRAPQLIYGPTWLGSWSDAFGHLEYWRFYQSAQFLYLGSVREVTEKEWNVRIRKAMKFHADDDVDIDKVPGFLSITEVVYNATEVFEFAARLAQAGIYTERIQISIRVTGIKNFMLAADENRGWSSDFVTTQNDLAYETLLSQTDLVASSAEHALKFTTWIFERFGWLKPNMDAIKSDQQKLLTRQW